MQYLETSVFLPICPAGLAKTILHVRRAPCIPLRTLHYLAALAWFASSTDANHQYTGVVAGHAAITIPIQHVAWLAITAVAVITQRYDRSRRRDGARCGSFVVIRYIYLFQFTLRLDSLYSLLLNVAIRRLPHIIVFDHIHQRLPR